MHIVKKATSRQASTPPADTKAVYSILYCNGAIEYVSAEIWEAFYNRRKSQGARYFAMQKHFFGPAEIAKNCVITAI